MYSKQEASVIKERFWASLGKYLSPVPNAQGEKINWINYKTGVKQVRFLLEADNKHALLGIWLAHKEPEKRNRLFTAISLLKDEFISVAGLDWTWDNQFVLGDKAGAAIFTEVADVSIFKETDWPAMITFFKLNLVNLDRFWSENRELFGSIE